MANVLVDYRIHIVLYALALSSHDIRRVNKNKINK